MTWFQLSLALINSLLLGLLPLWWWSRSRPLSTVVIVTASWPLGLAVSGAGLFAWLILTGGRGVAVYPFVESALVCALAVAVIVSARRQSRPTLGAHATSTRDPGNLPRIVDVLAIVAATVSVGLAFATIVPYLRDNPHGFWDTWAIWHAKARFLAYGEHWTWALSDVMIAPEYPLLLPLSIARIWLYAGQDSPVGAQVMHGLLGGWLVMSVWWLIASRRGRTVASMIVVIMLASEPWVRWASRQYVDVMLSQYVLLSVALLWHAIDREDEDPGLVMWAGVFAGLASFVKIEGLAFAAVFAFVGGLWSWLGPCPSGGRLRGRMAPLAIGLTVALIPALIQRIAYVGKTYLTPRSFDQALALLTDPDRHSLILQAGGGACRKSVSGPVLLLGLLVVTVVGLRFSRPARVGLAVTAAVVFGMGCAYYTAFLLTPLDLRWQLAVSVDRLGVQVWPLVLLAPAIASAPRTTPAEGLTT